MLRWNTKFKRIYFIWSDRIPYRKICPNAKTTFSSKILRKKIKYTHAKCEPHFDFTSAHCIVTFSNEFPVNSSKMFHMKRYNTTHPLPWINFEYVKLYKRYIEEAERKEIAKRLLQMRWVRAWVMEAWVQCQLLTGILVRVLQNYLYLFSTIENGSNLIVDWKFLILCAHTHRRVRRQVEKYSSNHVCVHNIMIPILFK